MELALAAARVPAEVQVLDYVETVLSLGTFRFLLASAGEFSFLEGHARLQFAHMVTERVTRLEQVQLQIAVASGRRQSAGQGRDALRSAQLEGDSALPMAATLEIDPGVAASLSARR